MRLTRYADRPADNRRNEAGRPADRLRGSLVAMVTPFRNGELDAAALSRLCERQVRRGTSGIVVCGSTGEAASLSIAEHGRVVGLAVEAACGLVPVVAGCGAPATESAVHLAIAAGRHGAEALLCSPPPYSRPTQDGIVAHVRAVAQASALPVILYDVPGRTGVRIVDETVARLFELGLIVGIKDAAGDLARPVRLRALCGGSFMQLAGDDATSMAHNAMGGDGCISVTANLLPALCAAQHKAWQEGDLDEVGRLRDLLSPLHDALFVESNPIPVKAALEQAGLCGADVRLPLTCAAKPTVVGLLPILSSLLDAEDAAAREPRMKLVM